MYHFKKIMVKIICILLRLVTYPELECLLKTKNKHTQQVKVFYYPSFIVTKTCTLNQTAFLSSLHIPSNFTSSKQNVSCSSLVIQTALHFFERSDLCLFHCLDPKDRGLMTTKHITK